MRPASARKISRSNTLGQSNLWGYGISGDLPIVLVRVTETSGLSLVRQLLHAQEYWRVKGLRADVVILNEHPAEYLDEVQKHSDEPRAGAALGRVERQAWRHVPAALGRHGRKPIVVCCRRSRASSCAAISAIWSRSSIGRRRGSMRSMTFRRTPQLVRPEPAATPVPVPPLVMENGTGRLHA